MYIGCVSHEADSSKIICDRSKAGKEAGKMVVRRSATRLTTYEHRDTPDMRLNLILPKVEPNEFEYPKKCPQKGCPGMRFIPRQEVSKRIVDAQHREGTAWRW